MLEVHPADADDALARSPRSLTRLVQGDVGLSFVALRARVRLHRSTYEIARGRPLAGVASAVGYRSPASYGAAFRAATGLSPGCF
ncbi:helix-turn-helix domain-containing protein [Nocardioides humi]|uniref:HTH araC/xylS-type domain-containing protein n=1 Tax=Nocardioides humi TaxID=449461 RepID=A0ABN1ZUQ7_9ACTN|nr:helix-turn-helix domain-containing protein [Nocardioides humi]